MKQEIVLDPETARRVDALTAALVRVATAIEAATQKPKQG